MTLQLVECTCEAILSAINYARLIDPHSKGLRRFHVFHNVFSTNHVQFLQPVSAVAIR